MDSNPSDETGVKKRRRGWDVATPVSVVPPPPPPPPLPPLPRPAPLIPTAMTMMPRPPPPSAITINLAASTVPSGNIVVAGQQTRIYVGSLDYNIPESYIRAIFAPFGVITKMDMSTDPLKPGLSKGYCFIEYIDLPSVVSALAMDGFEINGRKIKVNRPSSLANDVLMPVVQSTAVDTTAVQQQTIAATPKVLIDSKRMLVRNIHSDMLIEEMQAIFLPFGNITHCNFVNEISSTGSSGTKNTKVALVEYCSIQIAQDAVVSMDGFYLAGLLLSTEQTKLKLSDYKNNVNTPATNAASSDSAALTTVVLENMVSVEDSKDPTLRDDIIDEASKYGKLVSISLAEDSANKENLKVLLQYEIPAEATACHNIMNNRYFGKKRITSSII